MCDKMMRAPAVVHAAHPAACIGNPVSVPGVNTDIIKVNELTLEIETFYEIIDLCPSYFIILKGQGFARSHMSPKLAIFSLKA
jgi:hypothetical protein